MILLKSRGLLFIKGGKVAGSSVELFLNQFAVPENGDIVTPMYSSQEASNFVNTPMNYLNNDGTAIFFNHIDATRVRDMLGEEYFNKLESFGIVRNPYEKVKSAFAMHYVRNNGNYTIDQAIEEIWSEAEKYCDQSGNLLLKTIIKYENLNVGLANLFDKVDIPFSGLNIYEKSEYKKLCGADYSLNRHQLIKIKQKFHWEFENYYPEIE